MIDAHKKETESNQTSLKIQAFEVDVTDFCFSRVSKETLRHEIERLYKVAKNYSTLLTRLVARVESDAAFLWDNPSRWEVRKVAGELLSFVAEMKVPRDGEQQQPGRPSEYCGAPGGSCKTCRNIEVCGSGSEEGFVWHYEPEQDDEIALSDQRRIDAEEGLEL